MHIYNAVLNIHVVTFAHNALSYTATRRLKDVRLSSSLGGSTAGGGQSLRSVDCLVWIWVQKLLVINRTWASETSSEQLSCGTSPWPRACRRTWRWWSQLAARCTWEPARRNCPAPRTRRSSHRPRRCRTCHFTHSHHAQSPLVAGRVKASSHRPAPDTTKLSCLCRVRFGGVNWIPDNSRLSLTENLKSEHVQSNRPTHTGTPDTTQIGPFCRVWCGGVNWVGPTARQVCSASECVGRHRYCRCDRRTHSEAKHICRTSGRLNSHLLIRHRQHCLVVSCGRSELRISGESKVIGCVRPSVFTLSYELIDLWPSVLHVFGRNLEPYLAGNWKSTS